MTVPHSDTARYVLRTLRRQPLEAAVAVSAVAAGFSQLVHYEESPNVAAQGEVVVTLFALFLLFGGLLTLGGLLSHTPSYPTRGFIAERAGDIMLATALAVYSLSAFAGNGFVAGLFYSGLAIGMVVRGIEAKYQDESMRALGGSRFRRFQVVIDDKEEK